MQPVLSVAEVFRITNNGFYRATKVLKPNSLKTAAPYSALGLKKSYLINIASRIQRHSVSNNFQPSDFYSLRKLGDVPRSENDLNRMYQTTSVEWLLCGGMAKRLSIRVCLDLFATFCIKAKSKLSWFKPKKVTTLYYNTPFMLPSGFCFRFSH